VLAAAVALRPFSSSPAAFQANVRRLRSRTDNRDSASVGTGLGVASLMTQTLCVWWRDWLIGLAVGVGLLIASWGLLILLAKRLPPGIVRDLAAFIPDCVTTVRRLRKDPRVPRRAKIAIVLAGIWVASPIDLIPEFIPVIGPLDDIIVVALALRYAGREVPRDVLLAAWPGDPRLIERLLGTK